MHILAIESSCDDTAVALLTGDPTTGHFEIRAEKTVTQVVHKKYGGVVPEVAAREHAEYVAPLITEVLRESGVAKPDCIAVTSGPGLITSLLVGVHTGRALSMAWNVPLLGVNHIEGHIYANWLGVSSDAQKIRFPATVLIVSGGHTELILMKDHGVYKLLGKTRDDAAGECFDKVGKIMGFEYPGGPKISMLAAQAKTQDGALHDDASAFKTPKLPRPMIDSGTYEFSFAGLKTAALYALRDDATILADEKKKAVFAREVECAIVEVLVAKTVSAAKKFKTPTVMAGGGVVANKKLIAELKEKIDAELPGVVFTYPQPKHATDNAAMIATAAFFKIQKKGLPKSSAWKKLDANPNWRLN